MNPLITKIARKDLECDECGQKIPKGHRFYMRDVSGDPILKIWRYEHTNCEEYKTEVVVIDD